MKYVHLYIMSLLGIVVLAGCSASSVEKVSVPKTNQWLEVTGFLGGDTFQVENGNEISTITLLSVEAPSIQDTALERDQIGLQASLFTRRQLESSKEVRLAYDKEPVNSKGQIEAIVELKDGRILNELLITEGFAQVSIEEPNVKMENIYKGLEQVAKQNQKGMWRSGTEAGNIDIPVKLAKEKGIRLWVDKKLELVVITNLSDSDIDLDGWKLVSVKDNQTYIFHDYKLKANSVVSIASGKDAALKHSSPNTLIWEADHIWHLTEPDPAELYTDNNELVAVWED